MNPTEGSANISMSSEKARRWRIKYKTTGSSTGSSIRDFQNMKIELPCWARKYKD